jgi:hypothetical protein
VQDEAARRAPQRTARTTIEVRCEVGAGRTIIAQSREFMMNKTKLRAATIRVEPELWERIERLAQADRRPVASYLKLMIADAVAAQSAGSDMVAA